MARVGERTKPRVRVRQHHLAASSASFAEQRATWFADGTRLGSPASQPRSASADRNIVKQIHDNHNFNFMKGVFFIFSSQSPRF